MIVFLMNGYMFSPVFLMNGYMFSPSCGTLRVKQETVLAWPSLAEYLTTMVSFPRVFNHPVTDIKEYRHLFRSASKWLTSC